MAIATTPRASGPSIRYELYGDLSTRLMGVLDEFTPEVESYSIEEAFMNLAGIKCESYQALGKAMQARVHKCMGIPVIVGNIYAQADENGVWPINLGGIRVNAPDVLRRSSLSRKRQASPSTTLYTGWISRSRKMGQQALVS